jgi:hypothetical protein
VLLVLINCHGCETASLLSWAAARWKCCCGYYPGPKVQVTQVRYQVQWVEHTLNYSANSRDRQSTDVTSPLTLDVQVDRHAIRAEGRVEEHLRLAEEPRGRVAWDSRRPREAPGAHPPAVPHPPHAGVRAVLPAEEGRDVQAGRRCALASLLQRRLPHHRIWGEGTAFTVLLRCCLLAMVVCACRTSICWYMRWLFPHTICCIGRR